MTRSRNARAGIDRITSGSRLPNRLRCRHHFTRRNAVDSHRACDVLQSLIAKVDEGKLQLVANLIVCDARKTDAARLGNPFKSRGDIDAISEEIAIINNDIADVNADPEFDPLALAGQKHSALPCCVAHQPRNVPRPRR